MQHVTRRLFFQTTPHLSANLTARVDCNPRLQLHQVVSCSFYIRHALSRHFAPSNQNSTASPPDCRRLIKAAPVSETPVSETKILQPSDFVVWCPVAQRHFVVGRRYRNRTSACDPARSVVLCSSRHAAATVRWAGGHTANAGRALSAQLHSEFDADAETEEHVSSAG